MLGKHGGGEHGGGEGRGVDPERPSPLYALATMRETMGFTTHDGHDLVISKSVVVIEVTRCHYYTCIMLQYKGSTRKSDSRLLESLMKKGTSAQRRAARGRQQTSGERGGAAG